MTTRDVARSARDPRPASSKNRKRWWLALGAAAPLTLITAILVVDWYRCLPADTQATYVGGSSCTECHEEYTRLWTGSHHDLAMDPATAETVLGDFDDATLTHFGIVSRMYRDGERFMVNTEGPDGEMTDFEVKYVFGVEPLQQYMVEFDRPAGLPDREIARVQVLRISWDTQRKKWFFLSPPDAREKLETDDPLHWTGIAQNWNHMCAECHSTNLKKNYDLETGYHTTYTDIDVNCEACHGPGSIHNQLAKSRSVFWDRRFGYGLVKLKSRDPLVELHTCAPCHSRRSHVYPDYRPGENYYDHYANEPLRPETYYCDGQIRDEVYVFGSFIQSKMYANGIRCTDCHNPHTTKVKFQGNKLCTSCHTHDAATLDTPAHHRHNVGSTGSLCVECHMPASPFMDVDPRLDHSLRIPRPDLSVKLGTPNACTGCHLEKENVSSSKHDQLQHYTDWLAAARDGDAEIRAEIERVDKWCADAAREWYGDPPPDDRPQFAAILNAGWHDEPAAASDLAAIAGNRRVSGMVRASALTRLARYPTDFRDPVSVQALKDPDPQVRAAAVRNLGHRPHVIEDLLNDSIRSVRIETALALADSPASALRPAARRARLESLNEHRQSLLANADQSSAHMALGILAERLRDLPAAEKAYQTAIRLAPRAAGPRANLAALFERRNKTAEARRLREEEYQLLARDAQLVPRNAAVQNRFGLSAYLQGHMDESEQALKTACELEPNSPDYCLALALLYQKLNRTKEAIPLAERLVNLRPNNPEYCMLLAQLYQEQQRWSDAIRVVEHIVTLSPQDNSLRRLLATLRRNADRPASPSGPQPR